MGGRHGPKQTMGNATTSHTGPAESLSAAESYRSETVLEALAPGVVQDCSTRNLGRKGRFLSKLWPKAQSSPAEPQSGLPASVLTRNPGRKSRPGTAADGTIPGSPDPWTRPCEARMRPALLARGGQSYPLATFRWEKRRPVGSCGCILSM